MKKKIKRPKSVLIQGHNYQIISDSSDKCKEELKEELRGCIKYAEQKIYIDKDQHDESWMLTLLHEIVHGFLHHFGYRDNEKLIDNLATAIFTFLQENKLWNKLLKK